MHKRYRDGPQLRKSYMDNRHHRRFRLGDEDLYSRKRMKSDMDDRYHQRFRFGDEGYSRKRMKFQDKEWRVVEKPPKKTLNKEYWHECIGSKLHKFFFSPCIEKESSLTWYHYSDYNGSYISHVWYEIKKDINYDDDDLETVKQMFNEIFIMTYKNYFEGVADFEKRLHDMLKNYKCSEEKKQNWIFQRCQERNMRIVSNSDRIISAFSFQHLAQDTVKTCVEYLFNYYDDELMMFLCQLLQALKKEFLGIWSRIVGVDKECVESYCQRLYGLVDNPDLSMKVKSTIQKMQEKFIIKDLATDRLRVCYGQRRII
ncbi:uncharacterized protein LOC124359964 isoform X3 [Homalodisca vitripennis]|uniref:uncharacterized protein LOC124359964 isoform X3 n=1 Tax=Homalodisca vitripennis TaxID=197043 RepID=UPI001EEB3954|nr:uncharacterized protein LOC124359964 isoform X3 [Homalodisca vitripennis]